MSRFTSSLKHDQDMANRCTARREALIDSYQIHGILDGIYWGEIKTGVPDGKGMWIGKGTARGHRYEGDWVGGQWQGFGVCTLPDGARYEGQLDDHCFHGRGCWRSSDSTRLFDGEWINGWPKRGTALDSRDGAIYLVECDEETWIGSVMNTTGVTPTGWKRIGTLEEGQPIQGDRFSAALEWTGTVVLLDGTRFSGRMRGLRTDGLGTAAGRWDAIADATLDTWPAPASQEQVRTLLPSITPIHQCTSAAVTVVEPHLFSAMPGPARRGAAALRTASNRSTPRRPTPNRIVTAGEAVRAGAEGVRGRAASQPRRPSRPRPVASHTPAQLRRLRAAGRRRLTAAPLSRQAVL